MSKYECKHEGIAKHENAEGGVAWICPVCSEIWIEQNIKELITVIEPSLRAEIEALKAQLRWIPVEERLPERDGNYIVVVDLDFENLYARWYSAEFGWYKGGVTHWMPIPPAPPEVHP